MGDAGSLMKMLLLMCGRDIVALEKSPHQMEFTASPILKLRGIDFESLRSAFRLGRRFRKRVLG